LAENEQLNVTVWTLIHSWWTLGVPVSEERSSGDCRKWQSYCLLDILQFIISNCPATGSQQLYNN